MKKTAIIILAVLPIVLLVIISFAGRILSLYQHISVERVEFLNEASESASEDYIFTVEQGQSKPSSIRIYPELASNKKVSYTSEDEAICTVDENGVVTGVSHGTTRIVVKTDDGNKTAYLNVQVTADIPTRVELSHTELSMKIGENPTLTVTVYEFAALNKTVVFTSSDPSIVSVNASGKLTAHAVGTATITATAVSGGASADCIVTVVDGDAAIRLDFSEDPSITISGALYLSGDGTVNLANALRLGDEIDPASVVIRIASGQKYASFENGILTITEAGRIIRIDIYDPALPDSSISVSFMYQPS